MGENRALQQGRELSQPAATVVQIFQTSCLLLTVIYFPSLSDIRGTWCALLTCRFLGPSPSSSDASPSAVALGTWFAQGPEGVLSQPRLGSFSQQAAGIQMKQAVQGHPL